MILPTRSYNKNQSVAGFFTNFMDLFRSVKISCSVDLFLPRHKHGLDKLAHCTEELHLIFVV
jgi:hypothetical protein